MPEEQLRHLIGGTGMIDGGSGCPQSCESFAFEKRFKD